MAFTNSLVISVLSTALCVAIGSMAAYALARIQYKPKFGNIAMLVLISLGVVFAIIATSIVLSLRKEARERLAAPEFDKELI